MARGGLSGDGFRDGRDVLGRGAAAAADNIDQTGFGEFAEQLGHIFRALVVIAELVRQSGIGIGADECVGEPRQFGDMRAHFARAERAIEPDRERVACCTEFQNAPGVWPDSSAPGAIGDRAGNHHRHVEAALLANLVEIAKIAALALSVSKIVSISSRSAPPSINPRACSA